MERNFGVLQGKVWTGPAQKPDDTEGIESRDAYVFAPSSLTQHDGASERLFPGLACVRGTNTGDDRACEPRRGVERADEHGDVSRGPRRACARHRAVALLELQHLGD